MRQTIQLMFCCVIVSSFFASGRLYGQNLDNPERQSYSFARTNVPAGGKEKSQLDVNWTVIPQAFKAGDLVFKGAVRIVNKGVAPLPIYVREMGLGITLTDPSGKRADLATDLNDPEPARVPLPQKPRVFQILATTVNDLPVNLEKADPIILAPNDSFVAKISLNWSSLKSDQWKAFPSVEVLRQYQYKMTLPLVVGDSDIQIRHTASIPLSAHIDVPESR